MAIKSLASLSTGSTILIPETTGNVEYRVIQQNYNATQNGSGRTLIARGQYIGLSRDNYDDQVNEIPWSSGTSNKAYNWVNTTYPTMLDSTFASKIPTTSYCANTSIVDATSGIVQSKFLLPSALELNVTREEGASPYYYIIDDDCQSTKILSQANWIIAFAQNNTPILVRTGHKNTEGNPYRCGWGSIRWFEDGGYYFSAVSRISWMSVNTLAGVPMFTLPGNEWQVNDDGTLYQGPLPPSGFINFPQLAMQTQPMNLQWQESDGATSYTVQRKSNADADWVTIYTGANASTSETVGAWTSVQYRVSASNADGSSPYTESPTLNIVPASQLVISGQDGSLGVLTNDVLYTILSDTGNQISVERRINDTLVYSGTVDSGFSYSIPISELPTGANQIIITATVNTTSGTPFTLTRTWEYIKTELNFPTSASVATLSENQQNIYPTTLQEAVKTYSFWGGTLDKAMLRLSNSTFYYDTQTPRYTEYTVDMSKVQVGDTIKLPENGMMQDFIVCSLNYEPTLNTSGNRVLLTRKKFDSASVVFYENGQTQWSNSNILTYLNSTYLNKFDEDVKAAIGTTNYLVGNTSQGNQGTVSSFASAVFLLSVSEINVENRNVEGFDNQDGTLLTNATQIWNQYRIGNPYSASLRSFSGTMRFLMNFETSAIEYRISSTIKVNTQGINYPCFTLPTTFSKTFYIDASNVVHPEQEYFLGGSLVSIDGANVPVVKWAEGSYTGTGTYGANNPCSLSFESRPLYVFVFQQNNQYRAEIDCYALTNSFQQYGYTAYDDGSFRSNGCYALVDGATVSWYYSNNTYQMNASGQTYSYFAILA